MQRNAEGKVDYSDQFNNVGRYNINVSCEHLQLFIIQSFDESFTEFTNNMHLRISQLAM